MESINRLREYVENASHMSISLMARATLLGMVRDIEQEVGNMVPLPVDADGEPIHVGDVMEWPYGNGEFVVEGIGGNTLFYIDQDSNECEWTAARNKHHHHAPTVEDVLREFHERMTELGTTDQCVGVDRDEAVDALLRERAELVAEYAAKLRLAEEVDE